MRRHAKAATAGSTKRQASGLGGFFRGALVTRAASPGSEGSGAPAVRIRLALLGAAAALLASLLATPAQAAPVTIAKEGRGTGQVENPEGVAVKQSSGDLYVADRNNTRVDKFDSAGNFLLAWGIGVADNVTPEFQTCGPQATPPTVVCFQPELNGGPRIYPDSVAVDQSSGDVYYGDAYYSLGKFTSSGQLIYIVGRNINKTEAANPGATQAEKNICTAASGDACGIAEPGTGPNEFSSVERRPITLDAAGSVWVGDTDRVVQLSSSGAFVSEAPIAGGGDTEALAIDPVSGDFYAISASLDGVRRYTPSGSPVDTLTLVDTLEAGEDPRALGVDGSGNVYVSGCGPVSEFVCAKPWSIKAFDPAGEQVSQFGVGQVSTSEFSLNGPRSNALAVDDSTGALYVANRTDVKRFSVPEPGPLPENERATDVLRTSATLAADLNPEGHETTYHFEYGTTESYGSSTPVETLAASEFEEEEVTAPIEGLLPGTTYHLRLVATNHCNDAQPSQECTVAGEDATFTTLPVATLDSQWATDVSATAALLNAELGPLGTSGSWWVEYGTSEAYGRLTPQASLPASSGSVFVQAPVGGLLHGTTYHYRFVVENSFGTIEGADHTFTTQLSGLGFGLSDRRAWEMVSPPDKHGGSLFAGLRGIQGAKDGSGVAYASFGSIEAAPEGNRALEVSPILSRRGAGGSWTSKDIALPQSKPVGLNFDAEYMPFSSDLSRALVRPRDREPLSPQASEPTPYLRENTDPPTFTPLVTGKEGFANVPPGTVFAPSTAFNSNVQVQGANPDLTHVVIRSDVPLTVGSSGGLYLWSSGQIHEIGGGLLGSGSGSRRNAVSEDGSRVFFATAGYSENSVGTGGLYVRDTRAEETARLDVVQPGASGLGEAKPAFQGASADGTVVFFTDSRDLTAGSSPFGRDLYRCEIPAGTVSGGCATLTDVSAPLVGSGESAMVKDLAPGFSQDGSRIYFVAKGVLDTEPNGEGDAALPGEPNLYLWEEGEGVRFIATLSPDEGTAWGGEGLAFGLGSLITAAASPNGRYLAFMSERSLTGYDNREAASAEPTLQAFRYDAESGELACVSCNPTGARPEGQLILNPEGAAQKVDRLGLWVKRWTAATLPQANQEFGGNSFYRPRSVLDNGRVFFNSFDSLVPGDSNGEWDVYEYESSGVGDCTASSGGAAVSRSAGGCVSLVSSGTGKEEAAFIDTSATGDDVFFFTPARLSVTDEDDSYDVYDAHVDGVPATLHPSPECLGEACQPAAQAPSDPTPASAGFRGQGNVKPKVRKRCAKGKRQVRRGGKARCVTRKAKKHRRAGQGRRASR